MPLIHAMQRDAELATRVEEISERGCYEDGDRQWVRERVVAQDGTGFAMDRAKEYAQRAKSLLPETAEVEVRNLLAELAEFSAHRPY